VKKKLILILTFVLLVAFALPTAFAAMTDKQKAEVEDLNTQMHELRKQVIQKYVDAGELTKDEAKQIEERMDQNFENKKAQGFTAPGFGGGRGCGGGGAGFGGGCGGGGCGVNPSATADSL